MVGIDPIVSGICEFVRIEEILVGDDIVPALSGPSQVRIRAQVPVRIDGLELDAGIYASLVVEPIQHQRSAELPLIYLVSRHFQIEVGAELQPRQHLLHDPDVVRIRALGLHRIIGWRRRGRLDRGAARG